MPLAVPEPMTKVPCTRVQSSHTASISQLFYEGRLAGNLFKTVRVEGRAKPQHFAALTDEKVLSLLGLDDPRIGLAPRFCLLSGMRPGEPVTRFSRWDSQSAHGTEVGDTVACPSTRLSSLQQRIGRQIPLPLAS